MNTPHDMRIISDEFATAASLANQTEDIVFFSDDFKGVREWLTLGAACDLMTKGGITPAYYAEKAERPDFKIYSEDRQEMGGIEVAEAMPPGYRRHKRFKDEAKLEHLEPSSIDPPLLDPWQTLRAIILKKANKNYPPETDLLVYFNISVFSFNTSWSTPVLDKLISEHTRSPFEGVDQFRQVFVLDSGMTRLIQIYPSTRAIFMSSPGTTLNAGHDTQPSIS